MIYLQYITYIVLTITIIILIFLLKTQESFSVGWGTGFAEFIKPQECWRRK